MSKSTAYRELPWTMASSYLPFSIRREVPFAAARVARTNAIPHIQGPFKFARSFEERS